MLQQREKNIWLMLNQKTIAPHLCLPPEDPHPYCRGEAARGCDDGHPSPLDPALDEAATCDQYFDLPARGSTTRHCDEGYLEYLEYIFSEYIYSKSKIYLYFYTLLDTKMFP